ncbi:MAG: helix-hairpin-helix domain-containing protein [Gemmatimonadaceae bacterium]|jgi:DNA uptake protein ComE-like DNA-binding protein|nr:helix-hairpin-helix domain-containing protein [Gemmatimonadaceae bacterium]
MRRIVAAAFVGVLAASAAPLSAQVGKGLLDLNTATEAELGALPGMTPAVVKDLVAKRPFATIVEADAALRPVLDSAARVAVYRKAFIHVNLNAASDAELALIPDAGRRTIGEMKEYRPYDGFAKFRKELGKYRFIREKAGELERLESYSFVPLDLNTASDDDLRTIPGLGARMLREFKEYRPYDGMAKFRKEIAKYVPAKEVERLARYVEVKGK